MVQIHDRMHVFVKGLGDWSSSLCSLVGSGAALQVKTEGPFGKPVCGPKSGSHVLLLIAGGVGISPFLDLICNIPPDAVPWRKVMLIWAVSRAILMALGVGRWYVCIGKI